MEKENNEVLAFKAKKKADSILFYPFSALAIFGLRFWHSVPFRSLTYGFQY